MVVVTVGVLGFAEGEERGGVVGGDLDGGLEALDFLVRGGCSDAADVVFKGTEGDASGGGEKGLLGYVEVRVDLVGDLPGEAFSTSKRRVSSLESARGCDMRS